MHKALLTAFCEFCPPTIVKSKTFTYPREDNSKMWWGCCAIIVVAFVLRWG